MKECRTYHRCLFIDTLTNVCFQNVSDEVAIRENVWVEDCRVQFLIDSKISLDVVESAGTTESLWSKIIIPENVTRNQQQPHFFIYSLGCCHIATSDSRINKSSSSRRLFVKHNKLF